jgi:hypothetical protein
MKYCYLLFFILFNSLLIAQTEPPAARQTNGVYPSGMHTTNEASLDPHYCATDLFRQRMTERRSELMMSEYEMDHLILEGYGNRDNELLYIPIVIHIIHINGDENISDELVHSGIQHMNDAFANAGAYYSPDGFDMGIRFCLAEQTPDGLPTTGITRHVSALTDLISDSNQDIQMKNIVRWDPLRYVNIWLVREISSNAMGSGVAGYASLPNAHGSNMDGIVNEARWFGSNTNNSKIHIHEMGHYLGLYHTFEGGCTNNNCQTDGDKVCDTPPDGNSGAFPCSNIPNTCTSDEDDSSINNPFRAMALGGLGDQNDLIEDYMDYGLQECQRLFTEGQRERMRSATEQIRYSLLLSQVCESSCGIGNISIVGPSSLNVPAGTVFQAGSEYVASVPVSFEWIFNGSIISTQESITHTFNNNDIGQHYLYLKFINAADNCFLSDSILINIRCNPPASFTFTPNTIEPGDLVTFNGYHINATAYQWFINDQLVSTDATYSHTFENAGPHHIYLVTSNGQCTDTSSVQYLGIGECGNGANNKWIIGYASGNQIDFSSGEPVVSNVPQIFSTTPVLHHNMIGTIEGMATVSDRNGALLFYSDGIRLFNRHYEPFYNDLGAGGSSAQGALIVPDPADINSYYVFTAEHFGGLSMPNGSGLSYLKVDMTLNDGLGGVSSQYINLLPQCSEKLAATRHCNGNDIWICAHGVNDNLFYSFLVTSAGVQNPVITAIGQTQHSENTTGIQAIGTHKFSPQGDKLFSTSTYLNFAELFDFDNSTGMVSNPYLFPTGTNAYDGEFSPDGKKLYYASHEGNRQIFRCDISSGIPQLMTSSIAVVGYSTVTYYLGSMQLAPNGKIYIARSDSYLDVIHNPNGDVNDCGFETENLHLPFGGSYGLNNILVPKLYDTPVISGLANVCPRAADIRYKSSCGENTWEYIGNNEITILSNKEVSIDFLHPGVDTLICHRNNACSGTGSDTLLIQVGGAFIHLGNDTAICSSASLELHAGLNFQSYLWSTGEQSHAIHATGPGDYWVEVTAYGGCTARDTIHLSTFDSPFDVPDVPMINVCGQPSDQFHIVHAQQGDFTHVWDNNLSSALTYSASLLSTPSTFVHVPITYYNDIGCLDRDTITIQRVVSITTVSLGNDTLICPGELIVVSPVLSSPYDFEYLWPNNSMGESYTIHQAGTYMVRYRDSICPGWKYSLPMTVEYHPVPPLTLPEDDLYICEGLNYILDAGMEYEDFVWQDGSEGRYHIIHEAGTYSVTAQAECQSISDTINVYLFDESANALSFPDTLFICSNSLPFTFHPNVEHLTNHQWSNGTSNENLVISQQGVYSLMATNPCGTVSDTMMVIIKQQPATILPNDTYFCNGEESLTLNGLAGAVNTWGDSVVAESITVTETGVYHLQSLLPNGCTTIDSIYVEFLIHYLSPIHDTVMCNNGVLLLPIDHNGTYLHSNATIAGNNLLITQPGGYVAISSNFNGGCVKFESFIVTLADTSTYEISLPKLITVCGNELPIELAVENDLFHSYLWSNGDTTSSVLVTAPGVYNVEGHYNCGIKYASTTIEVSPTPEVSFNDTLTICNNETTLLFADPQFENLWSNGTTADTLLVSEPGLYWLQSTNDFGCYGSDSVMVIQKELSLEPIADTGFCAGEELIITAVSNAIDLEWSTGASATSIVIDLPGQYSVTATIDECALVEHFSVIQWPSPVFTLGNDAVVENPSVTLGISSAFVTYEWNVPDSTGHTLQVFESGTYFLTATNEYGCSFTDSINVTFQTTIDSVGTDTHIFIQQVYSQSRGVLVAKYKNVVSSEVLIYDAIGKIISAHNNFPEILRDSKFATGIYHVVVHYSTLNSQDNIYIQKILITD